MDPGQLSHPGSWASWGPGHFQVLNRAFQKTLLAALFSREEHSLESWKRIFAFLFGFGPSPACSEGGYQKRCQGLRIEPGSAECKANCPPHCPMALVSVSQLNTNKVSPRCAWDDAPSSSAPRQGRWVLAGVLEWLKVLLGGPVPRQACPGSLRATAGTASLPDGSAGCLGRRRRLRGQRGRWHFRGRRPGRLAGGVAAAGLWRDCYTSTIMCLFRRIAKAQAFSTGKLCKFQLKCWLSVFVLSQNTEVGLFPLGLCEERVQHPSCRVPRAHW